MTPAEIQARIAAIGGDTRALTAFLQGLSSAEYEAWARSVERINEVGGGALETLAGPAAGVVGAPLIAPGALAASLGTTLPPAGPIIQGAASLGAAGGAAGATTRFLTGGGGENYESPYFTRTPEQEDAARGSVINPTGRSAAPSTPGDPTAEYIANALATGKAFVDEDGNVQVYDAARDETLTFVQDANGNYVLKGGSSRQSADSAAATGLGYARLAAEAAEAESNRRFEAGENQKTRTFTAAENAKTREEGKRQFDQQFNRDAFESDREYDFTREKFATEFAEQVYQFDTNFALQKEANATRFGLEAEQLAAQVARDNATFQQQAEDRRRETLRNPSDYLYRAFESRGETSPYARVTHGDLLNTIASNLAAQQAAGNSAVQNARDAASRFANMQLPERAPATPKLNALPPGWSYDANGQPVYNGGGTTVPAQPTAQERLAQGAAPTAANSSNFENRPATAAETQTYQKAIGLPDWVVNSAPKAEHGGRFAEDMVVTGDSSDGKPNEELVIDLPNDGGLMVIPKDRLIGKRKRMGGQNKPVAKMENGGVLTPGGAAQPLDLAGLAAEATPPGVRDVLAGQSPANYRFAAPNLSLRRLGELTPGETDALSTNLAVTKNASLEDEVSQLGRLFGNVVSRPRSRMVSGGGRFG